MSIDSSAPTAFAASPTTSSHRNWPSGSARRPGTSSATSGRGRIVVGRDTRRSGDMLEAALVAGICAGRCRRAARRHRADAGGRAARARARARMVASSSRRRTTPPEYNGIKFFNREGFKLPDELEDEIEAFCESERDCERPTGADVGTVQRVEDAVERYIAHCVGDRSTAT